MASVLRSVIIFPLTAGHSKSRNLSHNIDAKISSAVIMACLVSVSLTCTLMFGALLYLPSPKPSNFLWGFYSLKDLLGFVCVIVLCVVIYNKRRFLLQPTVDYSRGRKKVFIWVFGLGYLLKDALNITVNATCVAIGGRDIFQGNNILSIISEIVSISFVASELGFISYFSNYKISSTKLTNYGMYLILTSNLTEWFKTVLREIITVKKVDINGTSDYYNSCYVQSPIKVFAVKHLYPFIQPAQTEYSLLATLILLGMMSSDQGRSANEEMTLDIGPQDCVESLNASSRGNYDSDFNARETESLLHTVNSSFQRRDNRKPLSFYAALATSIFLSLPFLVVTLIVSQSKIEVVPEEAYRSIETVFNISLLLVVLCAFHALRTQCREHRNKPISSTEWLLIFSNLGLGMDRTFCIAAFLLRMDQHSSFEFIVFFRHFIVFVNSFYQTILIIQASRYTKLPRRNVTPCIKVENCFMILHIMNFMLWAVSIFTIKHIAETSEDEVLVFGKGVWNSVVRILWPINIFYCFHSAMELYGLYRKFEKNAEC